jgi:hypothetical protein
MSPILAIDVTDDSRRYESKRKHVGEFELKGANPIAWVDKGNYPGMKLSSKPG